MTSNAHPTDLPAEYAVIRIVRLNYYRISVEALCSDGTYLFKEGSVDSLPTIEFTSFVKNADLTNGTDTRVAVKHDGGTNTRMVLDCTSPSEGYVSLEGIDGAWYRRLKFLSNGQIIYAYKATNGTEKTKVISEAPT